MINGHFHAQSRGKLFLDLDGIGVFHRWFGSCFRFVLETILGQLLGLTDGQLLINNLAGQTYRIIIANKRSGMTNGKDAIDQLVLHFFR